MMRTLPYSPHGLASIAARVAVAGALAIGIAACGDEDKIGSGPPKQGASASTPTTDASTTKSSDYRLADNGAALVDGAGAQTPVDAKLVVGYVDNATENGDQLELAGWAAPASLSGPADEIVALAGGKSISVAPSGDRPDLVKGYDRPGLAKAGFVISVPKSALDCSAADQGLKTFAVVGDTAGPLKWLADVPTQIADAC
jgi:hypothetical protein